MRKAMAGVALIAALGLLTGCNDDDKGDGDGGSKKASGAGSSAHGGEHGGGDSGEKGGDSGAQSDEAGLQRAKRKVTLEVTGEGKAAQPIMYMLEGGPYYASQLPFKKEKTLSLTPAQQKVGQLVTIVPGSTKGSDGMLRPAPCTITVDGKKVADNDDGKDPEGCKYKVH
ncbi:hypothetical protein [Streptomyces cacaoi]|uniref:hypothetical protein n=1 Tax=Streptomyces cacaoi TaxID=1898 RepID=UPI003748F793